MVLTIADCERELIEAQSDLARVQSELRQLSERQDELTKVVQGWQAIIASKRKQSGEMPELQNAHVEVKAASLPTNESSNEDDEKNKTQFVRDQIKARAAIGTTPKDLKNAAKSIGMRHPPSWPYGPIQRLKRSGEIVRRRGKMYPTEILKTTGE